MKRVGIVGAGFISESHGAGIAEFDNIEVAGFTDFIREAAEAKAAQYGGKVYESLDEMMADPTVDIIDVCVPTHLHEQVAMQVINAGKALLLEKPIARDKAAARRIVDAAKKAGIPFMIAHVIRFWPAYAEIKKMVDAGDIGDVKLVYCARLGQLPNWGDGWYADSHKSGGVIYNLTLHDYDFVRYLLGPIESVYGVGAEYGGPDRYEDVIGSLVFKNGAKAVVDGSMTMIPGYPFTMHIRVDGTKGDIEYIYKAGVNIGAGATEQFTLYQEGKEPQQLPCGTYSGYGKEISYFAECIEKGEKPAMCDPEEMVEVIGVLEGILESVKTGKSVKVG